ncbi:hypothetical protein [uncultured Jatrophihabitans sp.]|uniref:hypothetical protein n=1 Tax=uncultured Jatrophihabitans sp. TaxID=1610747 RepID=UPI0035C9C75E
MTELPDLYFMLTRQPDDAQAQIGMWYRTHANDEFLIDYNVLGTNTASRGANAPRFYWNTHGRAVGQPPNNWMIDNPRQDSPVRLGDRQIGGVDPAAVPTGSSSGKLLGFEFTVAVRTTPPSGDFADSRPSRPVRDVDTLAEPIVEAVRAFFSRKVDDRDAIVLAEYHTFRATGESRRGFDRNVKRVVGRNENTAFTNLERHLIATINDYRARHLIRQDLITRSLISRELIGPALRAAAVRWFSDTRLGAFRSDECPAHSDLLLVDLAHNMAVPPNLKQHVSPARDAFFRHFSGFTKPDAELALRSATASLAADSAFDALRRLEAARAP